MEDKKGITRQILEGERALFNSDHLFIQDTIFQNGESPLKQSSNITLQNRSFAHSCG